MNSFKDKTSLFILVTAVAAGLGFVILQWSNTGQHVDVRLPSSFSADANAGKAIFDENCRACHGANGSGTKQGPPLVHKIYEPSHHADRSFHAAVKNGTQAHHWPYGNMPPIPDVSSSDVDSIIRYVRELQRANAIS